MMDRCCTYIHKVLVKVRAAAVRVPRVVEAFLGNGVGIARRENLALHRLEGEELRGVVGQLADRVVCRMARVSVCAADMARATALTEFDLNAQLVRLRREALHEVHNIRHERPVCTARQRQARMVRGARGRGEGSALM